MYLYKKYALYVLYMCDVPCECMVVFLQHVLMKVPVYTGTVHKYPVCLVLICA